MRLFSFFPARSSVSMCCFFPVLFLFLFFFTLLCPTFTSLERDFCALHLETFCLNARLLKAELAALLSLDLLVLIFCMPSESAVRARSDVVYSISLRVCISPFSIKIFLVHGLEEIVCANASTGFLRALVFAILFLKVPVAEHVLSSIFPDSCCISSLRFSRDRLTLSRALTVFSLLFHLLQGFPLAFAFSWWISILSSLEFCMALLLSLWSGNLISDLDFP